jgi:hypothetical protein
LSEISQEIVMSRIYAGQHIPMQIPLPVAKQEYCPTCGCEMQEGEEHPECSNQFCLTRNNQ